MGQLNLKHTVYFAGLTLLMMGCAHVPPNSGTTSFSSYAESVFRHQNEVNSHLLMLSESDSLPDNEEFDSAEEAFQESCHLLNEYAEHESSGENMSLLFKSKVQDSVANCDSGIKRMEAVMKKFGLVQKY